MDGVIEGQKALSEVTSTERIRTSYEQYDRTRTERKVFGIYFLGIAILSAALILSLWFWLRKRFAKSEDIIHMTVFEANKLIAGDEATLKEFKEVEKKPTKKPRLQFRLIYGFGAVIGIVSLGISVYLLFIAQEPNPPFGF